MLGKMISMEEPCGLLGILWEERVGCFLFTPVLIGAIILVVALLYNNLSKQETLS
jgi:CBS-domain-containing membrane protein